MVFAVVDGYVFMLNTIYILFCYYPWLFFFVCVCVMKNVIYSIKNVLQDKYTC